MLSARTRPITSTRVKPENPERIDVDRGQASDGTNLVYGLVVASLFITAVVL
jgi:hypothetical protein